MKTYTNVFDLGDLNQALAEAFEIKKDRYKYEALGHHKTCLLIFFNNVANTPLNAEGGTQPWHGRHSARRKPGSMET